MYTSARTDRQGNKEKVQKQMQVFMKISYVSKVTLQLSQERMGYSELLGPQLSWWSLPQEGHMHVFVKAPRA